MERRRSVVGDHAPFWTVILGDWYEIVMSFYLCMTSNNTTILLLVYLSVQY
jgi:hypothetical protein